MAEFLNRTSDHQKLDGLAAMGKPIPLFRKSAALKLARLMGCLDTDKTTYHIDRMANCLERDEPYAAMQEAMFIVDLTGSYMLIAALCTAPQTAEAVPADEQGVWDRLAQQAVEGYRG